MKVPSTARPRRAAALLVAVSMLAGCASMCPRENPPPLPPPPPPGGPWHHPGHGPDGQPRDPAFGAAMQACLQELGVDKSDDAAGGKRGPARPDRAALDDCLRGKGVKPPHDPRPRDPNVDAAFQACRATLNLDDERGPPPPELRQQMDACLKEKGVTPPPPPPAGDEVPPPTR